jgi:hypothetical protein
VCERSGIKSRRALFFVISVMLLRRSGIAPTSQTSLFLLSLSKIISFFFAVVYFLLSALMFLVG